MARRLLAIALYVSLLWNAQAIAAGGVEFDRQFSSLKCLNGDVHFAVWDSKSCILDEESVQFPATGRYFTRPRLYANGKVYYLASRKHGKNLRRYSGHGFLVEIRLNQVGVCDYEKSNCTMSRYNVHVVISRQGEADKQLDGVAFSGS